MGAPAGRLRAARAHGARALCAEWLDLTEYLVPRGRPVPDDMRSNDRSFHHVAIVASDLDEAYRRLRAARVERTAAAPGLEPERRQDPRLLLPRSEDVDMDQWEAGFTDREGRFYNRQEAAHLFGVRGRLGSESYFAGAANPTLEAGHLEAWRKPALTSYWRAPVASSRVSTYACGTTLEHPCRAA